MTRVAIVAVYLALMASGCSDVERLGTVMSQIERAGREMQAGGVDRRELRFVFGGDEEWMLIAVPASGFDADAAIAAGVDQATVKALTATFAGGRNQLLADVRQQSPEVRMLSADAVIISRQVLVRAVGPKAVTATVTRDSSGPAQLTSLSLAPAQ